jgi:eukaryotic-like serine/threonine-protein kinase
MEKKSDDLRDTVTWLSTGTTSRLPQSSAFGRYEIKCMLGEGGQKFVYLARDPRLDRRVVVALLKTEKLDADSVARLWREAQTMAQLGDHPNIVTVFDVGEEQGRPYVVSEYVEGGSVEDLLKSSPKRPLPLEQAVLVAQQVCQALVYAHNRGFVHRDLKPSNVWLTKSGQAKLGDFGLALGLNVPNITIEGAIVGTLAYMSPEQALGRQAEPRSDLYSLGAMLYEMVTGVPPFCGDNPVAIVTQHINTPPVLPSSHNPATSQMLEHLILRLLAKAPHDRPENAAAVLKELSAIMAAGPGPAQPAVLQDSKSLARLAGGVFVGREREMRELQEALHKTLSGRGQLVMLVGEAGSGKTRLAEQLATYARIRGAQVFMGRCYEGEGAPAFWPWIQVVRAYVKDMSATRLKTTMGPGAADIAQLVSDVRERLPDLCAPPSLEPEQARFRLFDSFTSFLKNAGRLRALVLILDDLHWADAPSLMLLQFLVRDMSEASLLVIGTYRDTELGRHHPLAQTLAELARHSLTKRMNVSGLTEADVARFIELTAGVSPSETLVSAVYRGTEGNPFFVNEVVKLLVEEGRLDEPTRRSALTIPLPQGVRDVIGRRLDHLSETCNRVLMVASVIGREFNIDELELLCDASGNELIQVLDEAVAAKVIIETATPGQYNFVHALIRDTLSRELTNTRRTRLHRRIGEALENLYCKNLDAHVTELAYHFLQAAAAGNLDKAIGYSVRAAERANHLLAYEESADHYERALSALGLEDEPDEQRRCDLLLGLADAETKAGNAEKGWETFQEAAKIARKLPAADQFARAALGSGSWAIGLRYGKVDEAQVALLEEALAMLPEGDSALRAKVLAQTALACYHVPGERRLLLSQDALDMARRVGDAAAQVAALFSQAISLEGYEKARQRLEVATEIVSIAVQLGNKEMALRGHLRRLRELLEFGDLPAADREIEIYSRLADELRQPIYLWLKPFFKSSRAMLEGRFDDCECLLQESLMIGQRAQDQTAVLFFATNMTILRRLQGRFQELEPRVKGFVEKYPSIAGWRASLVNIHAELDWRDDARAEFEALAVGGFAEFPRDGAWLASMCILAQVCAYLHDSRRAVTLYEILLPFAGRNIVVGSCAAFYGLVSRHLGLLAATMSRWDEAARHFEDCLASCQRMGARPIEAYAQYEYGAMLLARGRSEDHAKADTLLHWAVGTATELGMAKVIADVQSLALSREFRGGQ